MHDVVFRNAATLTLLHTRSKLLFDPKQPVVFPNLRDLECNFLHPDKVAAFPRLKSLITCMGESIGCPQRVGMHDETFDKLFSNMMELEEVCIKFAEDCDVDVDAAIETLVQNNPSVSSVFVQNAQVTDDSLYSLSRLTGLQTLLIRNCSWIYDITTEGILSLMRGGSRNVLRELQLIVTV